MTKRLISIYRMDIDRVRVYPDAYCRAHFPERFLRAQRYRLCEDRLRCLGVGILLYEMLGLEERDIAYGEYGKPFSRRPGERFNITHSGRYAVLAVADSEVGVDLERIDAVREDELPEIGRLAFTAAERDRIREGEETGKRSIQLWTMKEAVTKALGRGLSIELTGFDALPLLSGGSIRLFGQELYGAAFSDGEQCLSVCSIGEPCVIGHMDFDMVPG